MANYTKATNFTAKDGLPSGNPAKIVKGSEIDIEFNAISSAIASKADINSPTFTGTPSGPTATFGSNTTQLATTAFVLANIPVTSATAIAGVGISVTDITTTGAATHTITNTGVTSVIAGTGISVSGATGAVTVSNSGVTSLNGQTGAITNTAFNAIGSYTAAVPNNQDTWSIGSTIAGSSLGVMTGAVNVENPFDGWNSTATFTSIGASGTYRAMSRSTGATAGCGTLYRGSNLWVRIS